MWEITLTTAFFICTILQTVDILSNAYCILSVSFSGISNGIWFFLVFGFGWFGAVHMNQNIT